MREATFIFFALCCITVCQAAVCPFPGIPAHAEFLNNSISWANRRSFRAGDQVEFNCKSYSNSTWYTDRSRSETSIPSPPPPSVLTCLPDGTWDKPSEKDCCIKLSRNARSLDVEYGQNPRVKWLDSCSSNQTSDLYIVTLPKEIGRIFTMEIQFCQEGFESFLNTSLDQIVGCSRDGISESRRYVSYTCKNVSLEDIQHSVSVNLQSSAPLDNIFIRADPKNFCGLPPVPVHADVVTEIIPGTTEVTYKCNDQLVLDPNGPQGSTCDQLTGRWTELPRCTCPDPHVPFGRMIRREGSSARLQCDDGYQLIGEETITCDDKGLWKEMPSCKASAIVVILAVGFALILLLMTVFFVTWIIIQNKRGFIVGDRNVSKRTSSSHIQMDQYEKCGPTATSNESDYDELMHPNDSGKIYEND